MEKEKITIREREYSVEVNFGVLADFFQKSGKDFSDLPKLTVGELGELASMAIAEGERLQGRDFDMGLIRSLSPIEGMTVIGEFAEVMASQVSPETDSKKN